MYPSFFEGFGYPPLEAMKYGTPVISSNVTSMPEILGDGALFFSPFYPANLFGKVLELKENYEEYREKAYARYKVVSEKQENDFRKLIDLILEEETA